MTELWKYAVYSENEEVAKTHKDILFDLLPLPPLPLFDTPYFSFSTYSLSLSFYSNLFFLILRALHEIRKKKIITFLQLLSAAKIVKTNVRKTILIGIYIIIYIKTSWEDSKLFLFLAWVDKMSQRYLIIPATPTKYKIVVLSPIYRNKNDTHTYIM